MIWERYPIIVFIELWLLLFKLLKLNGITSIINENPFYFTFYLQIHWLNKDDNNGGEKFGKIIWLKLL